MAAGVVFGSVLHFVIQLLTVKVLGFFPRFAWHGITDSVKEVVRLSFPRVLSVSVSQLTVILLIGLGSTLAAGSIAVFQFAQNLYFLPIGIFGVSYATTLFPRLSRAYIQRNAHEFFDELFLGARSILFWVMPSTVLFIVLRAHIVRVALGAGAFSWEDTRLTAAALAVLTLAIFAGSLGTFFMKGFYALENTWKPFAINIAASVLSIILALFFIRILSGQSPLADFIKNWLRLSDMPDIRVLGLALGFSIGLIVNTLLLYRALRNLAIRKFSEKRPFPIKSTLKIILASILAGGAAYLVRVSFSETLPLITFLQVLLQGVTAGSVGFAVYFGALFILKEESFFSLWRALERRFFGVKVLPPSWDGELHGK